MSWKYLARTKKAARLSEGRMLSIVRRPYVTEKSVACAQHNAISFEVARDATKPEIKEAVEALFKVEVLSVNTMRVKGKVKRFRNRVGRRALRKKAIIRVAAGQVPDLTGFTTK